MLRRPRRFIWGLAPIVLSLGCLGVPKQSATLEAVKEVAATGTLLQLRAYETGRLVSALIETAADSISRVSDDPAVRLRAVQWKVAAIPLVQEASLHDEPLVAVVDLWALALQHARYFENGEGRNAFGQWQEIAVAAGRQIVVETRHTFSRSVRSGEIPPEAIDAVPAWAASHPIRGAEMHRVTLLESDWNALGIEETTLPGTVVSLDQSMLRITQRLGYVNESLLKQVRWHAELTTGTVLRSPRADSLLNTLHTTSSAIGTILSDGPANLREVRAELLRDLQRQQMEAFAALDRQRTATLATLAEERVAAFADLRAERIATLASVDSLSQRSIDRLSEVATRAMRWLVAAAGLLVVGIAIGGVALARGLQQRARLG